MQSSGLNRWRYKHGAITEWKSVAPVLDSERLGIALSDLETFSNRHTVLPDLANVFDMFRMIRPCDVRVVFVAQSPYPGHCPATGIPYACGPALLPAYGCATTPLTLRNVVSELCRNMSKTSIGKPPREMLMDWVDQGAMLLNSSLTLGTDCPKHLEDHSILWHEIMEDVISSTSNKVDPIFVLIGKDAWKLGESCTEERVVRVSHPVARKGTSTPWAGSSVFSRVSNMMIERGQMPIRWV